MIISFVTKHSSWPFQREMPTNLRSRFVLGANRHADFLVVYDGLSEPVDIVLPANRTMVILPEPPRCQKILCQLFESVWTCPHC